MSSSGDGGVPFQEWQAARDLISNFDKQIHDLRQWGFSFITALLAAQSLLLPSLLPGGTNSSSSAIAEPVKFGVLSVTLVLIVALRQVEKNYQMYQKAANFRALILERQLNVELGTTVTDRYGRFHMSWKISVIYILFALADAGLGGFVLSDVLYSTLLVAAALVAVAFVVLIGKEDVYFARGERSDWTFDRLTCAAGDTLTITLTNMSESDPIDFAAGDTILAIRHSFPAEQVGKNSPVPTSPVPGFEFVKTRTGIHVEALRCYSWAWQTKREMKTGIYEVFPTVAKSLIKTLKEKDLLPLRKAAQKVGLNTPEEMKTEESKWVSYQRWVWPKPLARSITVTEAVEEPKAGAASGAPPKKP